MKRFFDFPDSLLRDLQNINQRRTNLPPPPQPAKIEIYSEHLENIRAVLWDVYGTLCGVDVGDLEKSMQNTDRLTIAAEETIAEFGLAQSFQLMFPQHSPAVALRDLYLRLIDHSHLRSLAMGIEYPEVIIEKIWETILTQCLQVGYQPSRKESTLFTAYRWAYFFDHKLQHTYLYPHALVCLQALKQAGIIQGIISNAQFYTPLHLRRLLCHVSKEDSVELQDYFSEPLVLFSYELGYSKPNSRAFQKAIDILSRQGIAPDEILYIGNDMLNDIWTAKKNGIKAMLYAGDHTQINLREDEPRCVNLRADAVVTDMTQIITILINR